LILLRVLLLALFVFDGPAMANKGPDFAFANLWILAIGELCTTLLETSLLRSFFKLSYRDALTAAVIANVTSFGLGLLAVPSTTFHLSSALYEQLAEVIHGETVLTRSQLPGFVGGILLMVAVLTLITVLIETPVYYLLLRRHVNLATFRGAGLLLLVNLISYPLFYAALLLATIFSVRLA
jgi:hypothetical protein